MPICAWLMCMMHTLLYAPTGQDENGNRWTTPALRTTRSLWWHCVTAGKQSSHGATHPRPLPRSSSSNPACHHHPMHMHLHTTNSSNSSSGNLCMLGSEAAHTTMMMMMMMCTQAWRGQAEFLTAFAPATSAACRIMSAACRIMSVACRTTWEACRILQATANLHSKGAQWQVSHSM